LSDPNNNWRSLIYSQSSINPANIVKIGVVNVEIIGLTESNKKIKIIKKQNIEKAEQEGQ